MTISYSHKLDHSPTLQGEHLLLEPNRISANSTTIDTVALGRKQITLLLSDEKKRTRKYIKPVVGITSYITKGALHGDAIVIS